MTTTTFARLSNKSAMPRRRLVPLTPGFAAATLLGLSIFAASSRIAHAEPEAKSAVNLPPSAELQYTIKAKQSGLPLSGDATVKWQLSGAAGEQQYAINSVTRVAMLGKIVDNTSRGKINSDGLQPEQFLEKRIGKPATTTTFEWDKNRLNFSANPAHLDLKGGEQDRSSAVWQLIAQARAAGDNFKPGSTWKMTAAYVRDADPWVFKVEGRETIRTALGDQLALHIIKLPPADSSDQKMDIWLAPALEWYPVRLRFSDADGNFVDQVIEKITK